MRTICLLASLSWAVPSAADEPDADLAPDVPLTVAEPEASPTAATSDMSAADIRRQGSDDFTAPTRELEVSFGLTYLRGREAAPTGDRFDFTDVGLLRSNVAYSPYGRFRLEVGAVALVKQPKATNNSRFGSAHLGVRMQLAKRWAATLHGEGGPLMQKQGYFGRAGVGVLARTRMNDQLVWEARGAVSGLQLYPDQGGGAWLVDAQAHASAQLCFNKCKRRYGAVWVAADFGAPLAHKKRVGLDPNSRLGLSFGTFVRVSKRWDMFASFAWIDYGDAASPGTQLPIMDGGFDQTQLTLGLIWHSAWTPSGPLVHSDR